MNDRRDETRDVRMQRYLDGEMDRAERTDFERSVAASDEDLATLYDELAVRSVLGERAERPKKSRLRAPRGRGRWLAAMMTAAAVVVVGLVLRSPTELDPVYRAGAPEAPRALEPTGELRLAPSRFVWTASASASSYRFEIFDVDGAVAFTRTVTDTITTLDPDDVRPRGAWRVTALDDLGIGGASTGRVEFWTRD